MPEWPSYGNFGRVPQKPAFSKKVQRREKRKFFKNRLKGCPRWKGPKAVWRKWHYPLNSMHLKGKDCRRFKGKKAAPKVPKCQVMALFARSPKTRIFWKKAKGDQGKFLKNRLKSSPRLKGLKALWRKWHHRLISMNLKCKDWKRFWRKKRLQRVPEWPSYGNFCKVTQNPHFLKKCKGGTKGNFSKIAQKVALVWKAQKHSCANGIIL